MNAHTFPLPKALPSPVQGEATCAKNAQVRKQEAKPFVSISFECTFRIEDMDYRKQLEQDARVGFSRGAWRP